MSVAKNFCGFIAVNNVSFTVNDGEFVTLLGPSGSGKSTILRLIAGLELPDSGIIEVNGDNVAGIPVQDRKVGFVFQHYALFRHMSLLENIAFGLRVKGGQALGKRRKGTESAQLSWPLGTGKKDAVTALRWTETARGVGTRVSA